MLNKFITWIKKLFNKSIINTDDLNIATEQQLAYEDIKKSTSQLYSQIHSQTKLFLIQM